MRPQQQNRRMRGRNNNNNNRKGPNPLTRSYESNGPDVKIRGSAQQIAEKYSTLARDAQSSGDRVMAENYLQHAEHYNRIIAAAQAQMPIQHVQASRDDLDDDLDDERDDFDMPAFAPAQQNAQHGQRPYSGNSQQPQSNGAGGAQPQSAPAAVNHAEAPQPVIEGMPAEVAFSAAAPAERSPVERDRSERNERRRDRRFDNANRNANNGQTAPADVAPADTEAPRVDHTLPAEAAPADNAETAEAPADAQAAAGAETDGASRRGRRPRRGNRSRGEGDAPQAAGEPVPAPDFDPGLAAVAEG